MAVSQGQSILDIDPVSLHQRTPLFIGAKVMVEELVGKEQEVQHDLGSVLS